MWENMKKFYKVLTLVLAVLLLAGCASVPKNKNARVYLYGEAHGSPATMAFEYKQWEKHYQNGMRHLFIEFDYMTAKYLNWWMTEDNDEILLLIYNALGEDNRTHIPEFLEFYQNIKRNCPETVFHGIDIWGGPEMEMLDQWLSEEYITSDEYQILKADCLCRENFLKNETDYYHPWAIREPNMVMNFTRELDSLPPDEKVMGIFGNAHVCYEREPNGYCDSMRVQLEKHYGPIFECMDLEYLCED